MKPNRRYNFSKYSAVLDWLIVAAMLAAIVWYAVAHSPYLK